ncbi:uncharacterized protein LOC114746925 [Neltuma alba]|uniref:uncharacterized protein LOC114746925 n=1 Tax=Neltuma alba TaxID=207710 RepID=UPI0010A53B5A|nr:uncharacterized protein LOC114746925 [Prosopis alba]
MESNSISSFVRILRESLFIFLKNKSLMACIALLILLLHSFLVSCKFFSIKPLMKDLHMEETRLFLTSPRSSQHTHIVTAMTADLHELVGLEWFFALALTVASLFSSATAVLASAITYGEGNISFRDLVSTASVKSCPRLFITWFYIFLFDLGYIFLMLLSIFPFALNFASPFRPTIFLYVILFLASAFHMYLAVVWKMSIVVSVLEEKSGVDSFGKASQILKGSKLQGFLLNIMFGVGLIVYLVFQDEEKDWSILFAVSGSDILERYFCVEHVTYGGIHSVLP